MAIPLLEAYAAGWALVEDAPVPTERAIADLLAATTVDEALSAGERTARRTAMERARTRLYHRYAKPVAIAAARAVLAQLDIGHLVSGLLMLGTGSAQKPARRNWLSTMLGAAVVASPELLKSWETANAGAWWAAVTRGRAEAEASTAPGPPLEKQVAGIARAYHAEEPDALAPSDDWLSRQIDRLAWHLSSDELIEHEDPEALVRRMIERGEPVSDSAEDLMHEALSRAFVDWWAMGTGTSLGRLWFVTEMDDRVCPECDEAEQESPYDSEDCPRPPLHPSCRCHLERG